MQNPESRIQNSEERRDSTRMTRMQRIERIRKTKDNKEAKKKIATENTEGMARPLAATKIIITVSVCRKNLPFSVLRI